MTQREFDQTMNGYRRAETEEKRPLQIQLDTLAAKRRAIGYEIAGLQAQLSAIAAQQSTLIREIKQIGTKYYDLKRKLIVENPKAVLPPPTKCKRKCQNHRLLNVSRHWKPSTCVCSTRLAA